MIPADSDERFSGSVEKALLRFGLQIIERPVYRFLDSGTTRTDSASVGGSSAYALAPGIVAGESSARGKSVTRPMGIIDVVSMYDDTKADFIVVTYASSKGRIRIVRRHDRAVFASIDFDGDLDDSEQMGKLYAALRAGGILKGKGSEMRCKSFPVPEPMPIR